VWRRRREAERDEMRLERSMTGRSDINYEKAAVVCVRGGRQPQNEIGRPNVTPARPIEDSNRAIDIRLFARNCNHFAGAIPRDGDHEATNH